MRALLAFLVPVSLSFSFSFSAHHKARTHTFSTTLNGLKLSYPEGSGFGDNTPSSPNSNDTTYATQAAREAAWERSYKSWIKAQGRSLAGLAGDGYKTYGRGGVLGYGDSDAAVSGTAAAYVKSADWEVMTPDSAGEVDSLKEIMSRVQGYDIEKTFVVVYRDCGLMGCDVVTPPVPPQVVAEEMRMERAEKEDQREGVVDVQADKD